MISLDLIFSVTPEQCPREISSQIARIHINPGHPRKQDLVRYLMLNGTKTVSVIAANALRCASCLRTKAPPPGPPSTLPRALQFNDRLSMDIVYSNDYTGKMHPFLGIFDKATWYHVVKRFPDRNSFTVFNTITSMWIDPFGIPLIIVCDQDGSLDGKVSDGLTLLGVQRLADSMQATSTWEIDVCTSATNNAKNKSMRRGGRSPEQNVFGRMPRLPQMLLSDEPLSAFEEGTAAQRMEFTVAAEQKPSKQQSKSKPVFNYDELCYGRSDHSKQRSTRRE